MANGTSREFEYRWAIDLGPVFTTRVNATIAGHFGFVFEEDSPVRKYHDYCDYTVIKKLRFHNVFRSRENEKPALSNSPGLKEPFRKAPAFSGLISLDRSINRIKTMLRFKIPPV